MQPALTTAQLQAIKAEIVADPTLAAFPNNSDGALDIAKLLNLPAVPDFWVWRTSVTKHELVNSTSQDGTVFNWTGAGFITRSQGERDAFRELFNSTDTVNPSLPQVRQAFIDIFSGPTVPAPANRAHLAVVSRRKATRVERLFAVGTGSTASPATMGSEGNITFQEVQAARAS